MKSDCRQFILEIEEHLDRRAIGGEPPHARACADCGTRWRQAVVSRAVLAAVEPAGREADPYFWTRLQSRLAARPVSRWAAVGGKARDWAVASALFAATLGLFVYNVDHTEVPNANEAIALDVPHLNPQHPSDDHLRPRLADAMLNLMNP